MPSAEDDRHTAFAELTADLERSDELTHLHLAIVPHSDGFVGAFLGPAQPQGLRRIQTLPVPLGMLVPAATMMSERPSPFMSPGLVAL